MKVLDLACGAGHVFEGWFASEEAFREQHEKGLVECPLCGRADVARRPSAPRLNLSGAKEARDGQVTEAPVPADAGRDVTVPAQAIARLVDAVHEILRHTQDVGDRFAQEARRIHHGEAEARAIRGRTTPEEREALADEGIEVLTLPFSLPDKGSLQ